MDLWDRSQLPIMELWDLSQLPIYQVWDQSQLNYLVPIVNMHLWDQSQRSIGTSNYNLKKPDTGFFQ